MKISCLVDPKRVTISQDILKPVPKELRYDGKGSFVKQLSSDSGKIKEALMRLHKTLPSVSVEQREKVGDTNGGSKTKQRLKIFVLPIIVMMLISVATMVLSRKERVPEEVVVEEESNYDQEQMKNNFLLPRNFGEEMTSCLKWAYLFHLCKSFRQSSTKETRKDKNNNNSQRTMYAKYFFWISSMILASSFGIVLFVVPTKGGFEGFNHTLALASTILLSSLAALTFGYVSLFS